MVQALPPRAGGSAGTWGARGLVLGLLQRAGLGLPSGRTLDSCRKLKSTTSQIIDNGVSILSAQTDVQHCVSTVVAKCTENGWATRRVFLDHLGTQVGHENKNRGVWFL